MKLLFTIVIFVWLIDTNLLGQVEISWDNGKATGITVPSITTPNGYRCVVLKGKTTPISGTWHLSGDELRFTPVLPFTPGLDYDVLLDGKKIDSFTPFSRAKKEAYIMEVYPTIDTVPANLLKIYISFSAPMGEEFSENFVTITDHVGNTLEKIFLPLKPELWNEDQDMLTLWLDPGRIKRDLGPNKHWGSPLRSGSRYHLLLSSKWKDKNGIPLLREHHKTLIVKEADRNRPDINEWQISLPALASRDLLEIDFTTPMDYVLANECLIVKKDGLAIKGTITLDLTQTRWSFMPTEPWSPGTYQLEVESRLEDLAGNNLNRLFDEEIKPGSDLPTQKSYSRYFTIQ